MPFTMKLSLWLQGLNILIPIIDQIKYVQSLKENALDIPSQSAITEGTV
jgi:regulator of protease activity HflC (stomatin/prohibitin superfamily)